MDTFIVQVILFLQLYADVISKCSNITVPEARLHECLFSNYKQNIIPRADTNSSKRINLDMYLMSIEDVDEKGQKIVIRAFLEISWKDDFLVWDPSDYSGTNRLNIQAEDIWIPDIALDSSYGNPTDIGIENIRANVHSDGTVIIWPYKLYTAPCKISIFKFPFDRQTCVFEFLSWSNPKTVLNLGSNIGMVDLTDFQRSGEWELADTEVVIIDKNYLEASWSAQTFSLMIKRKYRYYLMNVMLPVLCICHLNMFCFILPAASGERISLCVSVFLTLTVFLTIINSNMPESSDEVAMFSVYVSLQLFGSGFTIAMTVLSLCCFSRDPTIGVPTPLRLLVRLFVKVKHVEGQTIKSKEAEATGNKDQHVIPTWRNVSSAIDRLCLLCAVIWHTTLMVMLLVSVIW